MLLQGKRVTGPPPGMAVVFQEYGRSLFPWMSVRDNVDLPLRQDDVLIALLGRALAMLPHDQAEAVLLRYVVGLDAPAAARVLGKRPGAVRVAAHRGLRRLATLLPSEDVTDLPAASVAEVT